MPNLGLPELILIAFLAILFFGRDQLTELAKDAGGAIRAFKKEVKEVEEKVILEPELQTAQIAKSTKTKQKK